MQVFDQSGRILAMFLTISAYRPSPIDGTRITFNEPSTGAPYPIRAWFYPGRTEGEEFIYSLGSSTPLTD